MKTIQPNGLAQLKAKIYKKWNTDTPVGSIFRNMATLATGAGVVRLLGIFTAPVITRIYLPEHFAVLSIFTALVAMIVPFGSLRYSMAIPLPKNDGLATNLAVLCGIFLAIISTMVFVLFWATAPAVLELTSMEQLLPYWWLLPIAVAGTGFYEILSTWAVREKAFKPIAKTLVCQKIFGATFTIGLGLLDFKPLGLLIGQIFTQAGGILALLKTFWAKLKANFKHVSRKRIDFLIKRYADFPKYRLPSQFLLVFSAKAPLFFFAWHFGAQTTGQLGLALTILALPMSLFGESTGKAYYAEIAKIGRRDSDKIYKITTSITKKLFLVSIPPFFILVFLGPWLFQIVFGDVWREAGVFASVLAVYLLTQFVSSPLVNALNVFEKQKLFLLINCLRLFLIILGFGVTLLLETSGLFCLVIYSSILALYYTGVSTLIFRMIYVQIKRLPNQ